MHAQEGSRPCSTDRYRMDNTIVMLKRASVQFGKNTSENGNSRRLLLGAREETLPGRWAQGSEPCLATGFHVPAQLIDAQSAT